jgi:hypothetical protein
MKRMLGGVLIVAVWVVPGTIQAQFAYTTNTGGSSITITGYSGPNALVIPTSISNLVVTDIGDFAFNEAPITSLSIPATVTNIGEFAFDGCESLTNALLPDSITSIGYAGFAGSGVTTVTIPCNLTNVGEGAFGGCGSLSNVTFQPGLPTIGTDMFGGCFNLATATIPGSVTNIGQGAFGGCTQLTQVYFTGNAPVVDGTVFQDYRLVGEQDVHYYVTTAYYLAGTMGWDEFSSNTLMSATYDGPTNLFVPTVLWNPAIRAVGTNFGIQNGQYGFDVTGMTNLPIAIEASGDLTQSNWVVLQRLSLTNGLFHFSEPFQSNTPARFYRIGFP